MAFLFIDPAQPRVTHNSHCRYLHQAIQNLQKDRSSLRTTKERIYCPVCFPPTNTTKDDQKMVFIDKIVPALRKGKSVTVKEAGLPLLMRALIYARETQVCINAQHLSEKAFKTFPLPRGYDLKLVNCAQLTDDGLAHLFQIANILHVEGAPLVTGRCFTTIMPNHNFCVKTLTLKNTGVSPEAVKMLTKSSVISNVCL